MASLRVVKDGPKLSEAQGRVVCPKCTPRLGGDARIELVLAWVGAYTDEDGQISGGYKVWICGRCWRRADWTPVATYGGELLSSD